MNALRTEPLVRFSLLALSSIFFLVDPFAAIPSFLAITESADPPRRKRMARKGALTCFIVLTSFALGGQLLFKMFGITLPAFEIAGGLILFILTGRELVQSSSQDKRSSLPDDFGVVPLGMPLIAGPATITTLLVISQSFGLTMTLLALAANLALVALSFAQSERLERMVGQTGLRAVSKIIALLLAAIAVHIVRRGFNSP